MQVQYTALHCSYLAFIQIQNKPKNLKKKNHAVFMSGVNILVWIRLKPRYCHITVVTIFKLEIFGG